MATQTPNLGLVKPAGNERPLIGVLNGNADKIDAAIGDVDVTQDGSLQDQIDSIQESVNQKADALWVKKLDYVAFNTEQSFPADGVSEIMIWFDLFNNFAEFFSILIPLDLLDSVGRNFNTGNSDWNISVSAKLTNGRIYCMSNRPENSQTLKMWVYAR